MAVDQAFFRALADVVFGTPFTCKRDVLIRRLAPHAPQDLLSDPEALARVVVPKLEPLLKDGGAALRRLGADDRQVVAPALLYVGYHRALPQFDALIEKQEAQSEPLPV